MNQKEIMQKIDYVIENSEVGILTTVDTEGNPHTRWMTPTTLERRHGFLYCVTSTKFNKISHIKHNPIVEWMVQTKALDEVVTIQGKMNIVDAPTIKSELLEKIADRLQVFWKLNDDISTLIVLETIIQEVTFFLPMTGKKETVVFA
ncbi:pyridoxamine 5'-phosphate oxidase family protein [bacterium]|nr:pyridoxamine 5'-phosphate oxidase family protein [bacterium]MCP5462070.1 pyridoxamine 5'-phosphate oxidase family protein [bacterium]